MERSIPSREIPTWRENRAGSGSSCGIEIQSRLPLSEFNFAGEAKLFIRRFGAFLSRFRPLRALFISFIYRPASRLAALYLVRRVPEATVFLRGSSVRSDFVPLVSDVDFAVIIDSTCRAKPHEIFTRVNASLKKLRQFPFCIRDPWQTVLVSDEEAAFHDWGFPYQVNEWKKLGGPMQDWKCRKPPLRYLRAVYWNRLWTWAVAAESALLEPKIDRNKVCSLYKKAKWFLQSLEATLPHSSRHSLLLKPWLALRREELIEQMALLVLRIEKVAADLLAVEEFRFSHEATGEIIFKENGTTYYLPGCSLDLSEIKGWFLSQRRQKMGNRAIVLPNSFRLAPLVDERGMIQGHTPEWAAMPLLLREQLIFESLTLPMVCRQRCGHPLELRNLVNNTIKIRRFLNYFRTGVFIRDSLPFSADVASMTTEAFFTQNQALARELLSATLNNYEARC